jgi:uncharacterized membrane protein YcgQ (UPF0703/DUF1980 family)
LSFSIHHSSFIILHRHFRHYHHHRHPHSHMHVVFFIIFSSPPSCFLSGFQATLSSKIVRDDGFSRPEHVALEQAIMKARPYQRCPS